MKEGDFLRFVLTNVPSFLRPPSVVANGAAGDLGAGRARPDVADVRPSRPAARRLRQLRRGPPGRDGGRLLHPPDDLQHGRPANMLKVPPFPCHRLLPGPPGTHGLGPGLLHAQGAAVSACQSRRSHRLLTLQARPPRSVSTSRALSSCATWRTRRCSGMARTGSSASSSRSTRRSPSRAPQPCSSTAQAICSSLTADRW